MTTQTIQEEEIAKIAPNQMVFLPQRILAFLESKPGEELVMQAAIGKHGPFIFLYNKEQQRRWKKKAKREE